MANLTELLAAFIRPGLTKEARASAPAEGPLDRLDYDLLGRCDADAMWYYELRKWRGRD